MQSYLLRRYQSTKVDGHVSKLSKVTQGITQGSIVRPLLSILYVNDLFQEITDGEILMYTEDTLLSNTGDMLISHPWVTCMYQIGNLTFPPLRSPHLGVNTDSQLISLHYHTRWQSGKPAHMNIFLNVQKSSQSWPTYA